jgi:hypothetical protein
MKTVDHNVLYRYHILLIVYSYILVRSILSQAIISARIHGKSRENMRTAMAEPRTSLHTWKGSIIISVVLVRLYTISGERVSLLFDQLSRKDHISDKKTVEKSQKSIGDGRRGDDAE